MGFQSNTPCAVLLWLFRFTLLELVKGGYRGAKKGRNGRVECKGWNLTIDFLVVVLRQEGTRRVRIGFVGDFSLINPYGIRVKGSPVVESQG